MNEVIQNLKTRRSIRKFKPDMVSGADLDAIINAALYAPSTKGKQASHVLVIRGADKIDELNSIVKQATADATEPNQLIYKEKVLKDSYSINFGAPVFVVVSADTALDANTDSDGAVVLQSILLAAHSLGIASVWINQLCPISFIPVLREFLTKHGVPESYRVVGCAALGYNAGEHPQALPRKEGRVSFYG